MSFIFSKLQCLKPLILFEWVRGGGQVVSMGGSLPRSPGFDSFCLIRTCCENFFIPIPLQRKLGCTAYSNNWIILS